MFIEANITWTWNDRIADTITPEFWPIHCPSFDSTGARRPGVWTTDDRKEAGAVLLQALMIRDEVAFADEFISVNMTSDVAKRLLCQELRQHKSLLRVPKDPQFGKPRSTITGKAPGQKDDCAICAHQLVLNAHKIQSDSLFRGFLDRHRWTGT